MRNSSDLLSRFADKAGSAGAIVAAMGCSCLPALASLGAAMGLGFLVQWEGLFLKTLLPGFTAIAAVAQVFSWWSHRRLYRLLFGLAGPAMILATLYLFSTDSWGVYRFYAGLGVMFAVSTWDFISPPKKACAIGAAPVAGS